MNYRDNAKLSQNTQAAMPPTFTPPQLLEPEHERLIDFAFHNGQLQVERDHIRGEYFRTKQENEELKEKVKELKIRVQEVSQRLDYYRENSEEERHRADLLEQYRPTPSEAVDAGEDKANAGSSED